MSMPFSTCIILRSIADIARSEGHNIALLEVKLACLEVLALGGKSPRDDAAESGYWMVRGALAKSVSEWRTGFPGRRRAARSSHRQAVGGPV